MKRNKFSLSHYHLLTGNMGKLMPLTWYDVMPGDTIQHSTSMLVRTQPLLKPVMHPVLVKVHHFFVPTRLVWDDFTDFITGGPDGTDSTVPPRLNFSGQTIAEGGLHDYLGIPPLDYSGLTFLPSALPLRVYNLIVNNFYLDQDLHTQLTIDTGNGTDSTTSNRGISAVCEDVSWEKDYFTTCRPWESKGDEITIPLTGDAPVTGIGTTSQTFSTGPVSVYDSAQNNPSYTDAQRTTDAQLHVEGTAATGGYPNIFADLSAVSGVSINDLKLALGMQRYQQARAQFGSRYVEYLRYLGIRRPLDQRLQNPEYLGGGRQTITFSEVLASDGANTGDMYGHGLCMVRSPRFRRFIEEHGIIMTIMSVVPKSIYSMGVHRSWSRTTKEDYFQRELQHIGEQEVLNQEVKGDHASNTDIFGYQARYDEYRSLPSRISSEFHSTENDWHMARIFASDPSLNSTFITCEPTTRVFSSSGDDQMYIMANHSIQARRPMSKYMRAKGL